MAFEVHVPRSFQAVYGLHLSTNSHLPEACIVATSLQSFLQGNHHLALSYVNAGLIEAPQTCLVACRLTG